MTGIAASDLSGIWAFDQQQVPDDELAKRQGHVLPNGTAALHGTWTRMRYFRVRGEDDGTLVVFDDAGQLAIFSPDATDPNGRTWAATATPRTFHAGTASKALTPSLVLAAYEEGDTIPSGYAKDDVYVSTSADPAEVAAQKIVATPSGQELTWSSPTLTLAFFPAPAQQGEQSGDKFEDTFAGQSEFAQTAFPYYGFNPLKMLIYSEAGSYELPGTPSQSVAYTDRPGQTFIAPLIFQFPAAASHDYVRSLDLSKQPNLPIGRVWLPIVTKTQTEEMRVISSVADRMDSWSTTFGLSGGVEGMFSLGGEFSYHDQVETQKTMECRYVVTRGVSIHGVDIIHPPSLNLHPAFIDLLTTITSDVMAGKTPGWKSFVHHFGSHYLHAMTHGMMKFGETRMSLEAEQNSHKAGFDLEANAKASIEGGDLSSEAKYAQEWSDSFKTSVETQDVSCFQIGGDGAEATGILYDLRPISELLNPILLAYNGLDPFGSLAPWVWTDVRASLDTYLTSIGLGTQLPDALHLNYSPRTIHVAVTGAAVNAFKDGPQPLGQDWGLAGVVLITGNDQADRLLTVNAPKTPAMVMSPISSLPSLNGEIIACDLLVRGGANPSVVVTYEGGAGPLMYAMEALSDPSQAFSSYVGKETVEADLSTVTTGLGSAVYTGTNIPSLADVQMHLTLTVAFTETSRLT